MESGNHKLIIVDYYDALIRQVDIYTEEKLNIYSNDHLIEIKEEEKEGNQQIEDSKEFDLDTETFESPLKEIEEKAFLPNSVKSLMVSEFAIKINWPQQRPFQMKAQDYLNFMRDEMIKQIEIAKKETIEHYEAIIDGLDDKEKLTDKEMKITKCKYDETIKDEFKNAGKLREEELKRKLFENKFAFLFSRPYSNLNPFTLYLVITDFYLKESHLKLIK